MKVSRSIFGVMVLAALAACSDKKAPLAGKTCLVNSDCDNPLSCTYNKCHEACRKDGDCPVDQVCVFADVQGGAADAARVRVCIGPERCTFDSGCPAPLVCGRDLKCRNQCMADLDCPGEKQECVIGGPNDELVCAEPAAVMNGVLMTAADGGFPEVGAGKADGGDAHAPSDAHLDMSIQPGTDASLDMSQQMSVDGAADLAADTTSGGDVSSDVPAGSVAESEPNDTRETARPYVLGTKVQGTVAMNTAVADLDHYALTTPSEPAAGGYFEASLTDIGMGTLNAYVYAVADNGEIGHYTSIAIGSSFKVFWTAKAGAKYVLLIRPYNASNKPEYAYTLEVKYTPLADPFEPNDTRDTPKTIAVGQTVSAYYSAGYEQADIPAAAFQDWYSVPLAAGATTIKIANVPANITVRAAIYDEDYVRVDTQSAANVGATLTMPVTIPKAGTYRIAVDVLIPPVTFGTTVILPETLTRPYALTVTQ